MKAVLYSLLLLWPGPTVAQGGTVVTDDAAAEPAPLWSATERAAIDLLRALRKKERAADEVLAARLAAPGESLLPFLFGVLERRQVPAHDAGKPQTLSEIQEQVILQAMALWDRGAVLSHVEAQLALDVTPEVEPARRLAAMASIGAVGHGNDFPSLFSLALAPDEIALDRQRERVLRSAVTAILARDPKGFDQLVFLRRVTRPELLETLVGAIGAARDPAGLAYLSEVLYWHPRRALDVMCQVPLVGLSSIEGVNDSIRVRLRPYLDEAQPGACRAAILALAALKDHDSIAPLITLLGSPDAGLKENAHWALRMLTRLSLSPSRETWARWHQSELAWLVRSKAHEFQRLRDTDPAEVAGALRAILTHPLALDELRQALPELLLHRWPAARVLACRSLAEIDAKEAVGPLVWALEDPSVEVAVAAHDALRQLTALELPRDPQAWQTATHTTARDPEL